MYIYTEKKSTFHEVFEKDKSVNAHTKGLEALVTEVKEVQKNCHQK